MLAKGAEGDQYQQQNIQSEPAEGTRGATTRVCQAKKISHSGPACTILQQCKHCKSSMHLMGSRNTEFRAETGDAVC